MIELWKPLIHDEIQNGFELSSLGRIRSAVDKTIEPYEAEYHSTNGYDYSLFLLKFDPLHLTKLEHRLFPIDELLAQTFIPIPDELIGKMLTVKHIDGNNRNNRIDNLEWIEDVEEWKIIENTGDKFEISSFGNIRRTNTGKSLLQNYNHNGYSKYPIVFIEPSGRHHKVNRYIHRLVAIAFLSIYDYSGLEVNHIDGDKSNNHYKNLEWRSKKDNINHAFNTGLYSERTELTIEQADMIREMYLDEQYNQSSKRIYDALDHDKYPHITLSIITSIKYGYEYDKRSIYRTSNKYNIDEFLSKMIVKHPISKEIRDKIKELLLESNGDLKYTLPEIQKIDPDVTYEKVRWVKRNLKK